LFAFAKLLKNLEFSAYFPLFKFESGRFLAIIAVWLAQLFSMPRHEFVENGGPKARHKPFF
jgi:hypothetical protein